jgi:hypothetical protein
VVPAPERRPLPVVEAKGTPVALLPQLSSNSAT